ncbi:MAG: aspartate aminotransferase family protein [Mesorhizobium sp.]|uniref:aspartate aminotransferase family protein n=1 Tax=Mesorhizobium sp. TaxID=1871066 RepID=UPI001201B4D0|nr:aspartate aminotransferase family protein [Mesorhizobium sp.]TIN32501.1 MAG: aspartate aminotransferase family protein [Mesorhizobium sp.]TJU83706.1 MAG: aspartate aminotransferase family protein [Mesorhizobium sp.]
MLHEISALPSAALSEAQSARLFARGRTVFPDGTTRATVERDPTPRYVLRGEGAYLVDVDGQRFLDLNNNFTTLIHGHGFAPTIDAVTRLLRDGTCFSHPTAHEIELAELLVDRIPAVEQIRFVNTGTEAVMFAIKAARAFTGRPGIAKIEGAYHGSYDWAEAGQGGTPSTWGSAEAPVAVPAYAGTPDLVADGVVILRFNDADGARRRIAASADRLACVLFDPMPSRGGLIPPDPGFTAAVVETARQYGILVVCDEVLNLRQSYHGASARYGIEPDLIAAGKIIGGGFPVGAIGGSRRVMRVFDGSAGRAKLAQGGTFSANPVSMVAGRVSMEAMSEAAFARLEAMGDRLRATIAGAIKLRQANYVISGAASLFRIHPKQTLPRDYRQAYLSADEAALMKAMSRFFRKEGILLPSGAAACLSTAMSDADIDKIADVFERFLATAPVSEGRTK